MSRISSGVTSMRRSFATSKISLPMWWNFTSTPRGLAYALYASQSFSLNVPGGAVATTSIFFPIKICFQSSNKKGGKQARGLLFHALLAALFFHQLEVRVRGNLVVGLRGKVFFDSTIKTAINNCVRSVEFVSFQ